MVIIGTLESNLAGIHPTDLEFLKLLGTQLGGSAFKQADWGAVRVQFSGRGSITVLPPKYPGMRGRFFIAFASPSNIAVLHKKPVAEALEEIAEFARQVAEIFREAGVER